MSDSETRYVCLMCAKVFEHKSVAQTHVMHGEYVKDYDVVNAVIKEIDG